MGNAESHTKTLAKLRRRDVCGWTHDDVLASLAAMFAFECGLEDVLERGPRTLSPIALGEVAAVRAARAQTIKGGEASYLALLPAGVDRLLEHFVVAHRPEGHPQTASLRLRFRRRDPPRRTESEVFPVTYEYRPTVPPRGCVQTHYMTIRARW